MDDLGVNAGDGLSGFELLLMSQADGMEQIGEAPLGMLLVAGVVGSEAHFQVA